MCAAPPEVTTPSNVVKLFTLRKAAKHRLLASCLTRSLRQLQGPGLAGLTPQPTFS